MTKTRCFIRYWKNEPCKCDECEHPATRVEDLRAHSKPHERLRCAKKVWLMWSSWYKNWELENTQKATRETTLREEVWSVWECLNVNHQLEATQEATPRKKCEQRGTFWTSSTVLKLHERKPGTCLSRFHLRYE